MTTTARTPSAPARPAPVPVPVLLYHAVLDDPPGWIAPYTVCPRTFVRHLDQLADAGRLVVPLSRLVDALRGGPPLPPEAAVLTFDDGFADFYWTVAPELQRRDLPATLFVTTGAIHPGADSPSGSLLPPATMLSRSQLAVLDSCGIEIGGHSVTHPQMDTLPPAALRREVTDCRHQLEDVLSHPVVSFAYPHGYSSPAVRRAVKAAGWTSACAVANALSSADDHPLRIARLMVMADTPPERVSAWIAGRGAPVAPLPESLRTRGWRLYRQARALARGGRPRLG